jgi:hypothetical protein
MNEQYDYKYILNGRVNLLDETAGNRSYKITNDNMNLYKENGYNTISRMYAGNCVSETFFSKENRDIIQQGIINSVYNMSDGEYRIGRQSDEELTIIMRSMYFQYAKNLNFNIKEQVKELNTLVIRWCVDEILKNIRQYIGYKKSISTLPLPLEHSLLPSQKGTKTLEIKTFI